MSRIRRNILLTAALAVFAALFVFGVFFVSKLNSEISSTIESSIYGEKTYSLGNWQYRWGDSPVDPDGRFLWMDRDYDDGGWVDFEFPGRPTNNGNHRSIWIRAVLPVIDTENATLRLRVPQNTVEVYFGDAELDSLRRLSIVVIDIDGLKITNDTFGHNAGDELLKKAASIIRKVFRNRGSISRIGGDEFCVLLPHTDLESAQELTEHLLKLQNRLNSIYSDIPISMSVGLASTEESEEDEDIYDVYRRADDEMYRYKIGQTSSEKSRVVDMLLAALAEKDFVAQGHVERISELCMKMADALDLNEGQKRNLLLLSKIHDLGKIGVPDDILNKPGKLTKKEFEKMKTHVNIGFNIASRAKELVSVAPFILHHHEHWNGSGYPDGLRAEEIPLECRILSIIDAFDAMTNDRPYHKGVSVDEALEEISKCSGRQFDPFLVEKFVEIIKSTEKETGSEAGAAETGTVG